LIESLRDAGYSVAHDAPNMSKADYFEQISHSTIAVLPMTFSIARRSLGQVIADAAIANCVPTFSPRTKLFARLLMPEFLSYRSFAELLAKIHLLRDNPEWLRTLSKQICHRLRYADVASAETAAQLLERIAEKAPGDRRCGPPSRPALDRDRDMCAPHLCNAALGMPGFLATKPYIGPL